ncbi:hypothetical protein CPC698_0912B, partial [Chlamydia psittaci C6/98]
SDGKEYTDYCK